MELPSGLLLGLMMVVLCTCCTHAGNTTVRAPKFARLIPLRLIRRIHEEGLHDLLSSVRDATRHPAFVTFIREGNNTTAQPPLLLGAPRPAANGPPGKHNGGVKDLRDVDSERRAVIRDAVCKPRKQPVPVPAAADPRVLYTPPCVMLPRCSGCCSHELLRCVPTKVATVRKKVLALRFSSENQVTLADDASSVKRVRMEKHVKCECQCKIQSGDCTQRQRYDAANCRCVCPNEHESSACPGTKIWSGDDCACKCAEVTECSTGLSFDPVQCRCLPSRTSADTTLLFRAEAPSEPSPPPPSPSPPSSSSPSSQTPPLSNGGWGMGVSSGVLVDPPAPRRPSQRVVYSTRRQPPTPATASSAGPDQRSRYSSPRGGSQQQPYSSQSWQRRYSDAYGPTTEAERTEERRRQRQMQQERQSEQQRERELQRRREEQRWRERQRWYMAAQRQRRDERR